MSNSKIVSEPECVDFTDDLSDEALDRFGGGTYLTCVSSSGCGTGGIEPDLN
jgi:hypothetical protein